MADLPPRWFVDRVVALWLCFPSAKPFEPEIPAAWWEMLAEYPEWAIRRAFIRAPKEAAQGQYLPSAELVRRHAEVALKTPPGRPDYDRPALPPANIDGRALPEENPFAQLARSWEAESRQLGIHPGQTTPKEVGARRMREFISALEGKFDA